MLLFTVSICYFLISWQIVWQRVFVARQFVSWRSLICTEGRTLQRLRSVRLTRIGVDFISECTLDDFSRAPSCPSPSVLHSIASMNWAFPPVYLWARTLPVLCGCLPKCVLVAFGLCLRTPKGWLSCWRSREWELCPDRLHHKPCILTCGTLSSSVRVGRNS